MWVVRDEQWRAFDADRRAQFEGRMLSHVYRFFPRVCRSLGEGPTIAVVRAGIDKAVGYGLVSERDICDYLGVTFAVGPGFDVDPGKPWAKAILTDASIRSPTVRVARLTRAAEDHLRSGSRKKATP